MKKIPVWIDCDTGVDDAAALLCAHKLPQAELVGISAVAGNVELEKTYANCHRLNALMGADYSIYKGADKPWFRPLTIATYIHGEDGLGGAELPLPPLQNRPEPAWDALYAAARKYEGELELVAVGPLTNIANAVVKYPDLPQYLKRIVIMGGAAIGGNCTPCAEFNIYVDPHAAQCVFKSGIPVVMCGLDVTMKAYFTDGEIDAAAAAGGDVRRFFRESTRRAMQFCTGLGLPGVSFHDVCALFYVFFPDMFSGDEGGVYVETQSSLTLGKTVTDIYSDHQFEHHNAYVVLDLDRERFVKTITELLAEY